MTPRFIRISLAAIAASIATAWLFAIPHAAGVGYNFTPSMPRGLYQWTSLDDVKRDKLVLVCMPPGELATLAKSRDYFRGAVSDRCASGLPPLLKRVVAIPGDSVLIDRHGITVNGAHVAHSEPLQADSAGRSMPAPRAAAKLLGAGEFVVMAPHEKSLDSRYFGAIGQAELLNSAAPLLTF